MSLATFLLPPLLSFQSILIKRLHVRCIQDEGQEPKEEKVIVLQLVEEAWTFEGSCKHSLTSQAGIDETSTLQFRSCCSAAIAVGRVRIASWRKRSRRRSEGGKRVTRADDAQVREHLQQADRSLKNACPKRATEKFLGCQAPSSGNADCAERPPL